LTISYFLFPSPSLFYPFYPDIMAFSEVSETIPTANLLDEHDL